MKRVVLPALMIWMILLTLLTGCGGQSVEERLEAQRDRLAEAPELDFTLEVTALPGDEEFQCTLECAALPDRVDVEVLSPAPLAGVQAQLRKGETALRYGDLQLSLGSGAGAEPLGPVYAGPILAQALRSGHIIRAWTEGELLAAEVYAGDEYELTLWFSAGDLRPVAASASVAGVERLRCTVTAFSESGQEARPSEP